MVDAIEKTHEMRRIAQKAFCEYNAKATVKKALKARTRTWQDYKAGELVFVYRVPKARRKKVGGSEEFEVASNKAIWVGPGTVITPDGANLWVSMMGQLWKVAREQCRPATNEEKVGIEAVMAQCHDLIEEYKKNPKRAGYKDLTNEKWPDEEDDPEEDEASDEQRRGVKRGLEEMQPEEQGAEVPEEGDYVPTTPEGSNPGGPASVQEGSMEEPEIEEITSHQGSGPVAATTGTGSESGSDLPPVQDNQPSAQDLSDPAFRETWRRAMEESERLDHHHLPGGPVRVRYRNTSINPYLVEHSFTFLTEEEEKEEREEAEERLRRKMFCEEEERLRDFWEVDVEKKKLRRHHAKKRKNAFNPSGSKDMPFGVEMLGGTRKTVRSYANSKGGSDFVEDRWRGRRLTGEWNDWWCGFTEFDIEDEKAIEVWVAGRKGQDDVDLNKESKEDLEEWKVQDAAEWSKVAGSGAVEVLSEEESRKIREQLQGEGKEDRILPTKIARRYKPAEQPGEPATKKSRLCIRGDLDPDLLDLERFSPTINTVNLNLLLQIAANEGMTATVGDLKNAFCQSRPLLREKGELYFQQPKEGIQGLHRDQIVRIINGCYGLVDAPLHWRKSLIAELEILGYRPSRMDPCIFVLYDQEKKKLIGAIAIEVDDLFTVGTEEHHKRMERLQKRFKFGKYVKLQDEAKGASFNGRRIRQEASGEFKVDMQKFIQERLKK